MWRVLVEGEVEEPTVPAARCPPLPPAGTGWTQPKDTCPKGRAAQEHAPSQIPAAVQSTVSQGPAMQAVGGVPGETNAGPLNTDTIVDMRCPRARHSLAHSRPSINNVFNSLNALLLQLNSPLQKFKNNKKIPSLTDKKCESSTLH